MESNMVGWFEIPVQDMDRAKKFYDTVFDVDIRVQNLNELIMGWFPYAENKTLISDDIGYKAVLIDTQGNRIALHIRT